MKIISWNVNGLRAVYKKNFLNWLEKENADIVCLQEIKAQEKQIPADLLGLNGYQAFFSFAKKKGYSGVAVFTKKKPLTVKHQIGFTPLQFRPLDPVFQRKEAKPLRLPKLEIESSQMELARGFTRFDNEGRALVLEFNNFTLINLYLPHGGRQKENLVYKLEVYKFLLNYLKKQIVIPAKAGIQVNQFGSRVRHGTTLRNVVLIGDFNIAHEEIDLARPKQNRNNIMFTLEERKQIDALVKLCFTDTFRMFHPAGGHYTWWPYFANASPVRNFSKAMISKKEFAKISNGARARNLGWRIDYCFTSKSLTPKVKNAFILPEVFGSDHCPVGIEIQ